jgi:hypothetical protein
MLSPNRPTTGGGEARGDRWGLPRTLLRGLGSAPMADRMLARLDPGAQAELLRVLTSPSDVRAGVIRQMFERPLTRGLAEELMDLEADEVAHLRAIAELRALLAR